MTYPDRDVEYLVATHSYLLRVTIDRQLEVSAEVIDKGYYYGIGLEPSDRPGGWIAYRGGDGGVHAQNEPRFVASDPDLAPTLMKALNLARLEDVHQAAWSPGGLYVANTGLNALQFYDAETGECDEVFFGEPGRDTVHINSVFRTDLMVGVVLHNRGTRNSQVVLMSHVPGSGFCRLRAMSLWDVGCHNLFIDDRHLFYNGSASKRFVVVDLENDRIKTAYEFPGWHTKGLSATQDRIVVGLSEHAVRDRRATSRAKLAMFDRRSGELVREADLGLPEGLTNVGNVNEIRCMSERDCAHGDAAYGFRDWTGIDLAEGRRIQHAFGLAKQRILLPIRRVRGWAARLELDRSSGDT